VEIRRVTSGDLNRDNNEGVQNVNMENSLGGTLMFDASLVAGKPYSESELKFGTGR